MLDEADEGYVGNVCPLPCFIFYMLIFFFFLVCLTSKF